MPRWLVGAASLIAIGGSSPQDQRPIFRTTTELVLVDVLVTRGHAPVEGLQAEDFDVRDAGVRQKVDLLLLDSMPIDLTIALDVSASIAGPRLEQLKSAARAAMSALRPIDRVQLLDFSNDIRLASSWTTDRATIHRAINELRAVGWTSLIDATFAALALPEAADHRPLLLLVTDGRDSSSWLSPMAVLTTAEQSRTTVYAISTGTVGHARAAPSGILRERLTSDPAGFRSFFLPVLVNDTGGELLHASGPDLDATFVEALNRFRRRYLLSYTPTGVPRAGWHPIEVRVKDSKLTVTARRGYTRR